MENNSNSELNPSANPFNAASLANLANSANPANLNSLNDTNNRYIFNLPSRENTPINVIGIGLDGAAGLTAGVLEIIAQATLLVGNDRHLSYFPEHPGRRLVLGDFGVVIRQIRSMLEQRQPEYTRYAPPYTSPEKVAIVVLVSGDPLFFGLGKLLLAEIAPEQITFHPHVTSIQLAFNRLKLPWQDAKLLNVHERSLEPIKVHLQEGAEKIAILTESRETPKAIAQLYLALDLPYVYQLWVCENLGDDQEQVRAFSLDDQGFSSLVETEFTPLNVVILVRNLAVDQLPKEGSLPILGLEDQEFASFGDQPGLMTKREVRILVLGELALQPRQIVWDVGAGTGSVSIEIARLCPTSHVYALEKSSMGTSLIERNIHRLQVPNVISVHGVAPDMLRHLPPPDRIFIGGSGGNLEIILEACAARLQPDGLVVMALATIEHLHQSLAWCKQKKWRVNMLQVQLSKSMPISDLTRFTPLNPVTIITANP
ncbi:MAG: precorrin-6y C5,15-methyltransferase (decarboxylating) subunit CbiE [Coleofasciculaceae cyanobacterium SM2_1_6]|nr:precorrin-6y C5,15-methyltransferase (decarboxylating) subunit CbiE [Coleofasciculaceae cyanobacterium SM2_1_6]